MSGTFETSNPTGIKVFVVDKTLMDQWKQGKRTFYYGNIFYTSKTRVTSGSVNLGVVGMGTYYLVFDNTEVFDEGKDVVAKIELSYTRYNS